MKTGTHLLQWPVEEVDNLRLSSIELSNVPIAPGSVIPFDISKATQVSQIMTNIFLSECLFIFLLYNIGLSFIYAL